MNKRLVRWNDYHYYLGILQRLIYAKNRGHLWAYIITINLVLWTVACSPEARTTDMTNGLVTPNPSVSTRLPTNASSEFRNATVTIEDGRGEEEPTNTPNSKNNEEALPLITLTPTAMPTEPNTFEQQLQLIIPGKTSKLEVTDLLGEPSKVLELDRFLGKHEEWTYEDLDGTSKDFVIFTEDIVLFYHHVLPQNTTTFEMLVEQYGSPDLINVFDEDANVDYVAGWQFVYAQQGFAVMGAAFSSIHLSEILDQRVGSEWRFTPMTLDEYEDLFATLSIPTAQIDMARVLD